MFRHNLGIVTVLLIFSILSTTLALESFQFSENDFKLINPLQFAKNPRKAKQFSFFSEPEEEQSDEVKPEFSDPAEYYAKVQGKRSRRKRPVKK